LDRVADNVQEHLLELDRETLHHAVAAVLFLDGDSIQLQAAGLQLENVVENLGQRNRQQLPRVPIKAKGLFADVRNARQFFLSKTRVVTRFFIKRRVVSKQVEGVGDGFKRIVDFMRDDSRQPSHRCQSRRLNECVFSLLAFGDGGVRT
jgi:hypothetical protein